MKVVISLKRHRNLHIIHFFNLRFMFALLLTLIDPVWILPVYQHIFVAKKSMESFDHRLAMSQLCFAPLSSKRCIVKVLPIEKEAYEEASSHHKISNSAARKMSTESIEQPIRLGTIDIIRFIKERSSCSIKATAADGVEKYIELDLHLVLGSDTFMDLMMGKWKGAER